MTANPHGFTLNHTMLRVKDPEKSLEFYCGVLGMTLLRKTDIEAGEFSLYFLGFTGSDDEVPAGDADGAVVVEHRQAVVEGPRARHRRAHRQDAQGQALQHAQQG